MVSKATWAEGLEQAVILYTHEDFDKKHLFVDIINARMRLKRCSINVECIGMSEVGDK